MPLITNNSLAEELQDLSATKFKVSGYLESYYSKDMNDPSQQKRPSFIYSYNQDDSLQINLALIKAEITSSKFRAHFGVSSGTYMKANYVAENRALQHLYEANIGVKLSDQHNIWLDVGVMPSHIGFESAIGAENWTLTRSMMADNSPYFETGAKLSYTTTDGKWYVSGLLLNGWQRIHRPEGNTTPAIGHQITYRPNEKLSINSSSFIGNDKSDADRQMRYFHNLYAQVQLNDDWSMLTGIDVGAEQRLDDRGCYNMWYSPNLILKYRYSDRLSIAARAEYYQDKQGVIVSSDTPNGFKTQGYSVNMDYQLHPSVLLRTELRQFISKDPIFLKDNNDFSSRSLMATTALAISF